MSWLSEWKREIGFHKYLIFFSLIFLVLAIILDYAAGIYVSKIPTVPAPDLILDHLPTLDLDFIFIYGGALMVVLFFAYPLFFKTRELHKVIGQFSLLVMVRAMFTCLTHLQVPVNALALNVPRYIPFVGFQNDLFFSGHVAIPFLGFLLFKENKIKYSFLAISVIMGIVVLLMHVHYTIDVFSAFFITYGSFKAGEWFFNKINHYNGS
jgi:hypothetical protein